MNWGLNRVSATIIAVALGIASFSAHAEIDGHGPDSWKVTGVSAQDKLNARMGPATSYPVIESFAHNERGLRQITCVPFYTAAHFSAMTETQIKALPPRWCLMRNKTLGKAGWVAQRFVTTDDGKAAMLKPATTPLSPAAHDQRTAAGDSMIEEAAALVRGLYDAHARAEQGRGKDPLQPGIANRYFAADIVDLLRSGQIGAHPLYGAQDFDGRVTAIAPAPEQAMLRGMITVNVDFTNFGQQQRAVYYVRADDTQPDAPLRIISVDHAGWSYP